MTALPTARDCIKNAAAAHKLIVLDKDRLCIEFRDETQYIKAVQDLKKKGYMVFSYQPIRDN